MNEKGEHGTTALHWAACNNEAEIMRSLLQAGANPDACAVDGCTPLHYAAREDAAAATAMLLRFGADCRVTNNAGRVAGEEIYDDQDGGEGAEIARLLAEAAAGGPSCHPSQEWLKTSRDPPPRPDWLASPTDDDDGGNGGGRQSGEKSGAAQLSSIGASTGATFSSLEFAMADMFAALKKEKVGEGKPKKADFYPTPQRASTAAVKEEGRGESGGDGGGAGTSQTATSSTIDNGDGGGGGRVLVPRAYVPAADHDDAPQKRPEARTVTVKLRADGTLSDDDYRAVRGAYMETGLPRVDPQGYQRVPEVAKTKLEARRAAGAGDSGAGAAPVMVSSGCGEEAGRGGGGEGDGISPICGAISDGDGAAFPAPRSVEQTPTIARVHVL